MPSARVRRRCRLMPRRLRAVLRLPVWLLHHRAWGRMHLPNIPALNVKLSHHAKSSGRHSGPMNFHGLKP
jgi:hypothetical protein